MCCSKSITVSSKGERVNLTGIFRDFWGRSTCLFRWEIVPVFIQKVEDKTEVMKYKNRYCGMRIIMRLRRETLQRMKTVKMLARDVQCPQLSHWTAFIALI